MSTTLQNKRICFFGAGSMAEAIVRGLLRSGLAIPEQIGIFNRSNVARLHELTNKYGVNTAQTEHEKFEFLKEADIIFLAMKPKDAVEALRYLSKIVRADQLIVSVIAGLSIATMTHVLNQPLAIVRTMPNTSSTISLGATGISFSAQVTAAQRDLSLQMFNVIGVTSVVEESQLAAVTGISGSGPAYIYYMMEAMIEAGVANGLSREVAHELTVQTVLGAATMVSTTQEQPADLRRKVTSPNGTTQAALEVMAEQGFANIMQAAITRCAARADELGQAMERSAHE